MMQLLRVEVNSAMEEGSKPTSLEGEVIVAVLQVNTKGKREQRLQERSIVITASATTSVHLGSV